MGWYGVERKKGRKEGGETFTLMKYQRALNTHGAFICPNDPAIEKYRDEKRRDEMRNEEMSRVETRRQETRRQETRREENSSVLGSDVP